MSTGALVRYTAALVIVAAAFAIGANLPARRVGPGTQPSPEIEEQAAPAAAVATRPVIRHTRGSQLAWQAKLGALKITAGARVITAGPLDEAVIFARGGRPVVRVTATAIKGYADKRDFTVEGPVHAVSEQGAILQAAQMRWIDAEARLHCQGPLTARFRNAMATAPEADYYVEKSLVVVPGEVRLYVGSNLVVGRKLTYNITNDSFELEQVRMVLHAEKAKEELQKLRR
ncbi:MAG: hypothetical protein H5T86_06370 [Armatimonadetes bacterium]|nr:hypothetical protein [Armatimonadota bacterium]